MPDARETRVIRLREDGLALQRQLAQVRAEIEAIEGSSSAIAVLMDHVRNRLDSIDLLAAMERPDFERGQVAGRAVAFREVLRVPHDLRTTESELDRRLQQLSVEIRKLESR